MRDAVRVKQGVTFLEVDPFFLPIRARDHKNRRSFWNEAEAGDVGAEHLKQGA